MVRFLQALANDKLDNAHFYPGLESPHFQWSLKVTGYEISLLNLPQIIKFVVVVIS